MSKERAVRLFHLSLTGCSDSPEGISQEQINHIRLLNLVLQNYS